MLSSRAELDGNLDYRYLNCDEVYEHIDHETEKPTGETSTGVFYSTLDELCASLAKADGVVVQQIVDEPKSGKCLIAMGVGLTAERAREICDALCTFLPTDVRLGD